MKKSLIVLLVSLFVSATCAFAFDDTNGKGGNNGNGGSPTTAGGSGSSGGNNGT